MEENCTLAQRRQRKNFNQRVAYWIKQGMSADEASRQALVREQMIVSSVGPEASISHPKLIFSQPRRQQPLGEIYNFPQATLKSTLNRKSDDQEIRIKWPVEQAANQSFKIRPTEILQQIFCLLMVIGTSVILIKASWQVFGPGWEGFLKAFLLEVGILPLAVYQGRNILNRFFSKAGAIALACLSLFVLHTGIEGEKGEALKAVVETDAELTALKVQREGILMLQADLPSDHLKRREMLLGAVTDLTNKIEKAKTGISVNQTSKTVKDRYKLETLIRIALMYLGAIFAHHFVRQIKEVDFWGIGGSRGEVVR